MKHCQGLADSLKDTLHIFVELLINNIIPANNLKICAWILGTAVMTSHEVFDDVYCHAPLSLWTVADKPLLASYNNTFFLSSMLWAGSSRLYDRVCNSTYSSARQMLHSACHTISKLPLPEVQHNLNTSLLLQSIQSSLSVHTWFLAARCGVCLRIPHILSSSQHCHEESNFKPYL